MLKISDNTINLSACSDGFEFPTKYIPLSGAAARVVLGCSPNAQRLCHPTNGFFSYEIASDTLPVSQNHAEIWSEEGKVYIKDAASLYGTYVNGHRIDGRTHLRTGDIITLGVAQGGQRPVIMRVSIL